MPKLGQVVMLQSKKWWVASLEDGWAWLCRVDKPMEQCRLSFRASEFDTP